MESVMQRLKESIIERRESLAGWLKGAPPDERRLRVGPLPEDSVEERLTMLDTALKKAEDHTLGLCEICNGHVDESRLEMDYTASVCIEHLTGKQRTQLENELELSQKVQQALLPHAVPAIRGLEIAAFSQPAHIVGGDYFDFLRFKDGAHAIVIADVMGKGMPASMLMASLQASLRIIAPESMAPADVVARLNNIFCNNIRLTKFVTLFLARYDEASRVLLYSNAGHNPPLLLRTDGTVETLLPTGAAIGLVNQAEFAQSAVMLSPGDHVLMYTDGVVEAHNPLLELYGQERLEEFLRASGDLAPGRIIASLRGRLQEHSGASIPADDTTIISMKVMH